MESGTNILRDIHGLDAVPWWPPGQGWWYFVALVALLLLVAAIRYRLVYVTGRLGWRADARRQLRQLKKMLPDGDPQAVAGSLSELLRRIALVLSGRHEVAGLTGDEWLHWLARNDNTGFDWERHGQLLLSAPYMPPARGVDRDQLGRLIRAAIRLLDASRPEPVRASILQRLRDRLRIAGGRAGVDGV